MKYYFHKLGIGNNLVEKYLVNDKNPIENPKIAILYGRLSKSDIITNNLDNYSAKDQIVNFYKMSLKENRKETIIILMHSGKIHFLKPIKEMYDFDPGLNEDIYKFVHVKIIKSLNISDIPSILSGITSNRYISSGTFREITDWGNIKAICSVLNYPLPSNHLLKTNLTDYRLLECFGSTELETLVAKIFEDNDCFVPAYRGGNLKDIDLFVYNNSPYSRNINGLIISPKSRISIQVKHNNKISQYTGVDILINLSYGDTDLKCYGIKWIMNSIHNAHNQELKIWFKLSLQWLPFEFSKHFEILKQ